MLVPLSIGRALHDTASSSLKTSSSTELVNAIVCEKPLGHQKELARFDKFQGVKAIGGAIRNAVAIVSARKEVLVTGMVKGNLG